jgi:hypothetical protein
LVLEATIDRALIRLVEAVARILPEVHAADCGDAYSPKRGDTHRVGVRDYADAKRKAFEAHLSQASSDDGARTLSLLLKLPPWLFRRVLGREWFVEHDRPARRPLDDLFASLRSPHGSSADPQRPAGRLIL